MTPEALDGLEMLLQAGTPGPWEGPWGDTHTVAAFEGSLNDFSYTKDPRGDAYPMAQFVLPKDAALIAAMHNALPALIAAARRYQWLRENFKTDFAHGTNDYWVLTGESKVIGHALNGLDAAVDAALSSAQKG